MRALLEEKKSQISSLEEKHLHNREAMTHYRDSVKEQREQEQRKHELHTQQLQTEIRTLNQTISIKHNELEEWKANALAAANKLEAKIAVQADIIDSLLAGKDSNSSKT